MADGSWFVYRCPYEGPSATRVRRLPDRTPLEWFRRTWAATADADRLEEEFDAHRWVEHYLIADLGGDVYGLSFLFGGGPWRHPPPRWDRDGPLPATSPAELRELLLGHLYVEGPPDRHIRVDEHSVRAKTDDDEADLAYFFLDDALVRAAPDRVAFLLHGDWRLPATARQGRGGFRAPPRIRTLAGDRAGTGVTYAVVLSSIGNFGDIPPVAFAGVRLPQLARLLRTVVPAETGFRRRSRGPSRDWPGPLLALRALVAPGERTLGPALRRYNQWAWHLEGHEATEAIREWGAGSHATARAGLARFLEGAPQEDPRSDWLWRDRALSQIHATGHLVQAAIHVDPRCSYERWYLFDDVWASTHPDLAASLLRCAAGWDPFQD
jgi:hypothetical protein